MLKDNQNNKILMFSIFIIYVIIGFYHHDLWRDEAHSWLISSKNDSIFNLWNEKQYEGHPFGFYLVSFIIAKLQGSFIHIQILHFLSTICIFYIFVFKINMNQYIKYLLLFGAILGFEYVFYIRNYSFSALFFFIYLLLYNKDKKNYFLMFLTLSIMLSFNVFCSILACALSFELFFRYFKIHRQSNSISLSFISGVGIFIFGFIVLILSLIPPDDSGLKMNSFNFTIQVDKFFDYFKSFIFMGENNFFYFLFDGILGKNFLYVYISIFFSILIFLYITFKIYKKDKILFYYSYVFIFGVFCFFMLSTYNVVNNRHTSVFLLFIISLLVMLKTNTNYDLLDSKVIRNFIVFGSIIHLVVTIIQYRRHIIFTESNSKATAEYIIENYKSSILVSYPELISTAISFYTNKKVYDMNNEKFIYYPKWNLNSCWFKKINNADIKSKCLSIKSKNPLQKHLLIYDAYNDTSGLNFRLIKSFTEENSSSKNESLYLFEF